MLDLTDHVLRKAYSLSLNEYGVLMEIYWLSKNTKYGGWCFASKKFLAETLDLGEDTIYRAISKLVEIGLVEKEPDLKKLRTTDKFNLVLSERRDFAFSVTTKEGESLQVIGKPKVSRSETLSENQRLIPAKSETEHPQNQRRSTRKIRDGAPAKSETTIYKY